MRVLALLLILFLNVCVTVAQIPTPALVGYLHNWQDANAPYMSPQQADPRYNVLDIAFAIPSAGTDYRMEFIPDQQTPAAFLSDLQAVQATGRKVLISIGGATAPVSLDNISERDTFISTMTAILDAYDFDGMDIDLEGASLAVSGGTIANPADAKIIHLIEAIKQIMANYFSTHGQQLILTMAPETAFVQGGMSAYGGIWGAYLPVIHALRDSLSLLHVQLYNSGSMYGIDGAIYTQGTADFIVAMTEAVIQGFITAGGAFAGLPAEKVAVALPACAMAAGGGYADTTVVASAMRYLLGTGPQPGSYQLVNPNAYPNLGGMMTWSVNWDAVPTCGPSYTFADHFEQLFGVTTSDPSQPAHHSSAVLWPNPTTDHFFISPSPHAVKTADKVYIFDLSGRLVWQSEIDPESLRVDYMLPSGMYLVKLPDDSRKHRLLTVEN